MKVLQQRGWRGVELTCEQCASVLLVEADDIFLVHGNFARGPALRALCGYCRHPVPVPADQVPVSVQQRANRVGNHGMHPV